MAYLLDLEFQVIDVAPLILRQMHLDFLDQAVLCSDMYMHMRIVMCIYLCMGICIDICVDMCIDMCIYMCKTCA